MTRPVDLLEVELLAGVPGSPAATGVFRNFTSFEAALDLNAPSEASFELGDDDTWQSGGNGSGAVSPGARYQVRLNGRPLLTGRVESNDLPFDAQAGAVVRFTIRTKLADAYYASADQKIAVKSITLRDFLLAVYAPLGYTVDDFVFNANTARDLRTGRPTRGKTSDVKLQRLTVEEARVSPPEPIFSAADRHLRRFGLMHWDGPDDTIVVGFPDQGMRPIYQFVARRRFGGANNMLASTRAQDYSSVPSSVAVYGTSAAKRDFARSRISAVAVDLDVTAAGFPRPVTVLAEQMRNQEAVTNAAWRELSERRRNKDKIPIEVDGLSYWDGTRQIGYSHDTMCEHVSDVAGGSLGNYYVTRCVLRRDPRGDSAHLTTVRAGILQLFPDVFEGGAATPQGGYYKGPPEAAPVAK